MNTLSRAQGPSTAPWDINIGEAPLVSGEISRPDTDGSPKPRSGLDAFSSEQGISGVNPLIVTFWKRSTARKRALKLLLRYRTTVTVDCSVGCNKHIARYQEFKLLTCICSGVRRSLTYGFSNIMSEIDVAALSSSRSRHRTELLSRKSLDRFSGDKSLNPSKSSQNAAQAPQFEQGHDLAMLCIERTK